MKKSTVAPMKNSDVEKLNTKALIARLAQLRKLTERAGLSDLTEEEIGKTEGLISFKNTSIWRDAWADVKRALSKREHVQRGSKERRRQEAFQKKHR
jgi:hypothetical protein